MSPAAAPVGPEAVVVPGRRLQAIPTVADAPTPLEDVLGLLQVAAEVEHALFIQYLYAAASIDRTTGTPPPNIKAKITSVAIQEMAHLVTVQNLLLAVGGTGAHHLGRDALREASDLNPMPFVLEPLSHNSVAKYVVVEQPETIEEPVLRARVARLEEEVFLKTGFDPKRVGELYAAIYWLFQPSDEPYRDLPLSTDDGFRAGWHLAESDFRPVAEVHRFATILGEWHGFPNLVVDVATDPATACDALHRVMAQGEGLAGQADAHFEQFMEVLDAADAGRIVVAPLPRSPYVVGQKMPGDPAATELTHPYTRPWGQLFNRLYTHVVLCLGHALSLPTGDGVRDALREAALHGMRPMISGLTRHLRRLRVNETDAPDALALAGPTYGLLAEDLPQSAAEFESAHREHLAAEDALKAEIAAHPDHAADTGAPITLAVVSQFQDRIRALFP